MVDSPTAEPAREQPACTLPAATIVAEASPAPDPDVLTAEELANWQRLTTEGDLVMRKVAAMVVRLHAAAAARAAAEPAPASGPSPGPGSATPAPQPQQPQPALTPSMKTWPTVAASSTPPTTEELLRRVANPTLEAEPAIAEAADRLCDVLHDWGSGISFRRILADMRQRAIGGDRHALPTIIAALKKARSPGVDRAGAVFTWAVREGAGAKKPARASP